MWRRTLGLQAAAWLALVFCVPALAEPPHRLEAAPFSALPPFSLERLDGARAGLSDLRGSPVLVHFFATWCEPCKAEFSTLARFAERRPGIKILAINVAEPAVRVHRFATAQGITLPILLDTERQVTKAWNVTVLPMTFVLDPSHVVRLFVEGDLDWTQNDTVSAIDAATAPKP